MYDMGREEDMMEEWRTKMKVFASVDQEATIEIWRGGRDYAQG